jgi:hypothetical protein
MKFEHAPAFAVSYQGLHNPAAIDPLPTFVTVGFAAL